MFVVTTWNVCAYDRAPRPPNKTTQCTNFKGWSWSRDKGTGTREHWTLEHGALGGGLASCSYLCLGRLSSLITTRSMVIWLKLQIYNFLREVSAKTMFLLRNVLVRNVAKTRTKMTETGSPTCMGWLEHRMTKQVDKSYFIYRRICLYVLWWHVHVIISYKSPNCMCISFK